MKNYSPNVDVTWRVNMYRGQP